MCDECARFHKKQLATAHHELSQLADDRVHGDVLCPEHEALITGYCTRCKKAVCEICEKYDCAKGGLHKIIRVNDYAAEVFTPFMKKANDQLVQAMRDGTNLQIKLNYFNEHCHNIKGDIRRDYIAMAAELNRWKTTMLDKVRKHRSDTKKQLKNNIEALQIYEN